MNHGHGKKILSQCNQLIKTGLEVNLLLVVDKEIEGLKLGFIRTMKLNENDSNTRSDIISKIRRQRELRKILINLIESASSSDIIYLRYPYPLFYMLWPFSRRRKICKIVGEHNTIEHKEFKLVGSYLFFFVDLMVGKLMRRRADGIVGVTNEITSYEIMRSGDFNKPHITIGNGIEVEKIRLRKPPIYTGKELRILCVASFLSRWHGFDRLLRGLALYRGSIKVRVYIVGDGQELLDLRQMVKDLKLEGIVVFTGFISGSAFDDLFDTFHIAVGSLALHRMDMKEASVLKARDYCARGIPFLYGSSDPDFPDDLAYIFKVPADETPINIEDVIRFAGRVYSDPEHHVKMRTYAEENLDWSIKMKKLKEFCESLVEG